MHCGIRLCVCVIVVLCVAVPLYCLVCVLRVVLVHRTSLYLGIVWCVCYVYCWRIVGLCVCNVCCVYDVWFE